MPELRASILITGANGFVGSRLCRKFADERFQVVAGVRPTSDLTLLKDVNVVYRQGDVTQSETLPRLVAGVDYVIHNAGVTKARHRQTFFDVNERGTRRLFEAIQQHNRRVKKVVYMSSLAAAGPSLDGKPLTESHLPHPITAYGESKLAGERMALTFRNDFPVVVVRPPGVYGPGEREILGFFKTVNRRIRPYFGNTQRQLHLVHVDDLCQGVYRAVCADTESGDVFFVAENRAYAMRELIRLLADACGRTSLPVYIPGPCFRTIAALSESTAKIFGHTPMLTREKARELLASWAVSTNRARQTIGFDSQIPFERGARETFRWYRERGWLK